MSGMEWPVVIEATGVDVVTVDHINGCVSIMLTTRRSCLAVTVDTNASATLRAALEAAEKEMS